MFEEGVERQNVAIMVICNLYSATCTVLYMFVNVRQRRAGPKYPPKRNKLFALPLISLLTTVALFYPPAYRWCRRESTGHSSRRQREADPREELLYSGNARVYCASIQAHMCSRETSHASDAVILYILQDRPYCMGLILGLVPRLAY